MHAEASADAVSLRLRSICFIRAGPFCFILLAPKRPFRPFKGNPSKGRKLIGHAVCGVVWTRASARAHTSWPMRLEARCKCRHPHHRHRYPECFSCCCCAGTEVIASCRASRRKGSFIDIHIIIIWQAHTLRVQPAQRRMASHADALARTCGRCQPVQLCWP